MTLRLLRTRAEVDSSLCLVQSLVRVSTRWKLVNWVNKHWMTLSASLWSTCWMMRVDVLWYKQPVYTFSGWKAGRHLSNMDSPLISADRNAPPPGALQPSLGKGPITSCMTLSGHMLSAPMRENDCVRMRQTLFTICFCQVSPNNND